MWKEGGREKGVGSGEEARRTQTGGNPTYGRKADFAYSHYQGQIGRRELMSSQLRGRSHFI